VLNCIVLLHTRDKSDSTSSRNSFVVLSVSGEYSSGLGGYIDGLIFISLVHIYVLTIFSPLARSSSEDVESVDRNERKKKFYQSRRPKPKPAILISQALSRQDQGISLSLSSVGEQRDP
jgi:hypothetical protein